MNEKAIGIYDSGVGGLTVFKEIKKKMPEENIIYLGDTRNFPYGNKEKEEIIKFAVKNTEILIQKQVKVVIVACGIEMCWQCYLKMIRNTLLMKLKKL